MWNYAMTILCLGVVTQCKVISEKEILQQMTGMLSIWIFKYGAC